MPVNVVKTKRDERIWSIAKDAAEKRKTPPKNFWRFVMGTFQRIKNKKGEKDGE